MANRPTDLNVAVIGGDFVDRVRDAHLKRCEEPEDVEVKGDVTEHAGTLHFDGHVAPVEEGAAVNLGRG